MTCDCCGESFVDEVGVMLIEEAVVAFRDALLSGEDERKDAFAEALQTTQAANAAAKAASGS